MRVARSTDSVMAAIDGRNPFGNTKCLMKSSVFLARAHRESGRQIAWIAVGIWNGDTSAPFWGMAASQFLISGTLLWIAFGISRRRPHALDRIFGPAYRRSEMHFAMVAQIFPVLNGGMRLYEQAVGSVPLNLDRASRLGLVVFMLVGVAVCLFRFTWSSGSRLDRAAAQRAWAIVFLLGMTAALSLGELEGRRTAQLRGANCTAAAAAAGGTM